MKTFPKGSRVVIETKEGDYYHKEEGKIEGYDKGGYLVYLTNYRVVEYFEVYEISKLLSPRQKREFQINCYKEMLNLAVELNQKEWFNELHEEIKELEAKNERINQANKINILKNLAIELGDKKWQKEINKRQLELQK